MLTSTAATTAQLSSWWNRLMQFPTPSTSGLNYNTWNKIATGNNVLVAVGGNSSTAAARSTNGGVTWTNTTLASSAAYFGVAANGATFVAVSSTGFINYSTNSGSTWTSAGQPLGSNFLFKDVAYGAGLFVAIGLLVTGANRTYVTSPDGITWTSRTFPGSGGQDWLAMTFGGGKFVVVTTDGNFFTSTDGITWSTQAGSQQYQGIAYGNSYYVAVQYPDLVAYSTDGLNWTSYTLTPSAGELQSGIGFGNGKFLLSVSTTSAGNNLLYYAADPTAVGNWTQTTLPFTTSTYWLGAAVYSTNNSFYSPSYAMLGYDFGNSASRATVSGDGITWY